MSLLFGLVSGVLLGSVQALPAPQVVTPAKGGVNQLSPIYPLMYEVEMMRVDPYIPVA